MQGIVQELLRLERAKQQALIRGDAPAYDESVREQLHVLNSSSCLEADARENPDQLKQLAIVVRRNIALFWNLMSISPVFEGSRAGYTAQGNIETRVSGRVQVEA